jgi:hypothetical protein
MQNGAYANILLLQFTKVMQFSTVLLTRLIVIISRQSDWHFGTTTIEEILGKDTIVILSIKAIDGAVKIDVVFHCGKGDQKNSESEHLASS